MTSLLFLLFLAASVPSVSAQDPVRLYDFEMTVASGLHIVEGVPGSVTVPILIKDLSRDGGGGFLPEGGAASVNPHLVEFRSEVMSAFAEGWFVPPISSVQTFAGGEAESSLLVQTVVGIENPFFQVRVNATMRNAGGEPVAYREAIVNYFSTGVAGFTLQQGPALELAPREVGQTAVIVMNRGTVERVFDFEVLENTCGLRVVPPTSQVVLARERKLIAFSAQAPEDRFWYYGVDCSITIGAVARDNPGFQETVPISAYVDGFYVAPEWMFWTFVFIGTLVLIVLFVRRHKAKLEEEIFGKPQKPWLIPVEAVYLEHLKRRDQRAWYVVRHFLMEEEHRSAMLWYKNQRKADKGRNQKERLILAQEHHYERWKRRWVERIAKPERKADRYEAKLQRKLDRKAKALHKKALKRHQSVVQKQQKAYQAQLQKATERWEKQRVKAEKKGLAVPPRPVVPEPEIDDPPQLQPIHLAGHRWHKKAERARRKAARKRGDLEVRFEKADARHLLKVRRKVRKLARKIDDPDFVKEHPLLHDGAKA